MDLRYHRPKHNHTKRAQISKSQILLGPQRCEKCNVQTSHACKLKSAILCSKCWTIQLERERMAVSLKPRKLAARKPRKVTPRKYVSPTQKMVMR